MSTRPSRPFSAAALAALVALPVPAAVAQPSLVGAATHCAPPARLSPVGAATCADPAARLADQRRAQAYAALRDQLPAAQRPALEENARAFETFLSATCASPAPDADCLVRFHAAKREDLRRWLAPPAREEADRDPADAAALERRLAARGLPTDPVPRREAIAALQQEAGLAPNGFLDTATAALLENAAIPEAVSAAITPVPPDLRPEPAASPRAGTTLPPDAFWSSFIPTRLAERFAVTDCAAPAVSWSGRGLWMGGSPVPGETSYEVFGQEDPAGDRVFLVPPGGDPRIIRLLPDGTIGLEGVIPSPLAERGIAPGAVLRPCGFDAPGTASPVAADAQPGTAVAGAAAAGAALAGAATASAATAGAATAGAAATGAVARPAPARSAAPASVAPRAVARRGARAAPARSASSTKARTPPRPAPRPRR